jgi:hypothetical protein
MADDKFKLPQSSYEELTKIIKSYGHFTEPADLTELSKLSSLHTTIVSRNNGFLIAIGILEPGSRKVLSPMGRALSRALEHEMPDEMRQSWRDVVTSNDFLSKIIAAIRIRSGMDQQTLEAHVAYSAGQPKKPQFMTGARTVIDILKAAEVIKEADGKYIADTPAIAVEAVGTAAGSSTAHGVGSFTVTGIREGRPQLVRASPGHTYQLNINVNINCAPEDLRELGKKLRHVIQQLKKDVDENNEQSE